MMITQQKKKALSTRWTCREDPIVVYIYIYLMNVHGVPHFMGNGKGMKNGYLWISTCLARLSLCK